MRIIAGAFKGTALAAVGKGDTAAHLRPTTDRVRESLFNVLAGGKFGDPISDAQVLDLFAGSGALGLEALSRGAANVVFVDDGRAAGRLIRDNIKRTRSQGATRLMSVDALRLPENDGPPATLVFCDPPYGKGLAAKALGHALSRGWIADDALVVVEESAPLPGLDGFEVLDSRRYGSTHVTFLEPLEG